MIYFRSFLIFTFLLFNLTGINSYGNEIEKSARFTDQVIAVENFPKIKLASGQTILLNHLEYIWEDKQPPHLKKLRHILKTKLLNHEVTIQAEGNTYDVMGYIHGLLKLEKADRWINFDLLEQGLIRAQAHHGFADDFTIALQYEGLARQQKKGLWQQKDFAIIDANHPDIQANKLSGFQIAQGYVVASSLQRNYLYLNFGANWRDDFTIGIPVADKSLDAKQLETTFPKGSFIEIRGFMESWNGPFIRLDHQAHLQQLTP